MRRNKQNIITRLNFYSLFFKKIQTIFHIAESFSPS